jgi:hypothetical protein
VYSFSETALEWVQAYKINQEMDEVFSNATEDELEMLTKTKEICCICLKSFGKQGKDVRKVECGHFFHMPCLEEVLKRAGGTKKASCPICRQKVVAKEVDDARVSAGTDAGTYPGVMGTATNPQGQGETATIDPSDELQTQQPSSSSSTTTTTTTTSPSEQANQEAPAQPPPPQHQPAQQPLFRFSTEAFPAWFPQFSFEVVSRANQVPTPLNDQVNFISDMFPAVSRERIEELLRQHRSADDIVNMLLEEPSPAAAAVAPVAANQQQNEGNP